MRLIEVVDFLRSEMEKANGVCLGILKKTGDPGLKKLLTSLMEREKENATRLAEWREALADDARQRLVSVSYSDSLTRDKNTLAQDAKKMLLALINHKKALAGLLVSLSAHSPDEEGRFFFQKLAEDEKRQKDWVQDRYDLAALK